jgi:hypothetical protein
MLGFIDISVDRIRGLDEFFKKNGKISEAVREVVRLRQSAKHIRIMTQIILVVLVPREQ